MKGKKLLNTFANGIIHSNPTFRLVLGMCPTLAVTVTMINGLAMGLATMFVLICSNVMVSLLRKVIPDKIRIPAYIVIVATFVTLVEMLMYKFLPDLYDSLGVFISLIVVNCIILARAEAFASSNPVLDSAVDGLSMGLGFTLALGLMGFIRELIGSGKILGHQIISTPISVFALPAGAFLTLGLLMALFNFIYKKYEDKKKAKQEKEILEIEKQHNEFLKQAEEELNEKENSAQVSSNLINGKELNKEEI